ncbi:MAG: LysM peptidoglycan-binding domain-containing protein [Elusimicrobiota bacterium]|nr:LysM peptidoglycan-binding domain-containing protein [Elusimicrobiota bacterium]
MNNRQSAIVNRKWLVILLALTLYPLPFALIYAAFEDIGIGARPISMGNAFTAVADSVYSIHYNPAGLTFLQVTELSAEYNKLFYGLGDNSDLFEGHFGIAIPVKKEKIAFGIGYKKFSLVDTYSEEIGKIAFGYRLLNWLSAGTSIKYFNQKFLIANNAYYTNDTLFKKTNCSRTYDADFGLLVKLIRAGDRFLPLGVNISNILQNEYGINEVDKVKLTQNTQLGIGYFEGEETDGMKFCAVLSRRNYIYGTRLDEKGLKTKQELDINLGIEKWLLKVIALRNGFCFGLDRDYKNISAGIGINITPVEIDYAWLFPLSGIEDIYGNHHLSLVVKFGKKEKHIAKVTPVVEPTITLPPTISQIKKQQDEIRKLSTKIAELETKLQEASKISTATPVQPIQPIETITVSTPPVKKLPEALPEVSTKPVIAPLLPSPTAPLPQPIMKLPEFPLPETPETAISTEPVSVPAELHKLPPPVEKEAMPEPKILPTKPPVPSKPSVLTKDKKHPIRIHKVEPGDTLEKLAEKYYNDKSQWIKLYKANETKIQKGLLKIHDEIVIP